MSIAVSQVVAFLEAQRLEQQRFFGAKAPDKVLAFVGSCSVGGSQVSVSAHRLLGLERGTSSAELVVRLAGTLPRQPTAGELASVCLFNQYVGYQVKTRAVSPAPAVQTVGGVTTVRGSQVYTLHHSPFMATAFERVPLDEVVGAVGAVPFALVGVGPLANLSPRFNWYHEVRDDKLVLFHGDGLPLKTYLNVKTNPRVARVLIDPTTFAGFLLDGVLEEYQAAEEPAAHQATTQGFEVNGWGRPARTFRFTTESILPVAPVAPAARPAP